MPCAASRAALAAADAAAAPRSARAGAAAVSDFTVLSASGTAYGPGGLLPVPEPASLALWAGGLLALAARWRLRRAAQSSL